jgi:hypothetical protein
VAFCEGARPGRDLAALRSCVPALAVAFARLVAAAMPEIESRDAACAALLEGRATVRGYSIVTTGGDRHA